MTVVTYLRSSSYATHEMCAMKHFLNYTLGWREPSNQKAEKGTIVHKVMEVLAEIKLAQQNGLTEINDDIAGKIDVNNYDLADIKESCYHYYSSHSNNKWVLKDRIECDKWVDKALEYGGGEFDPRNANIVKAEQAFDFEIKKDWARYSYDLEDGEKLEGYLSLKGTIDQISKLDDDLYQILDWKTGRRLNWATGKTKEYADLQKDPQLRMYYYAAHHLFPEIENIEVCIYFMNDGGPFRLCFSPEDIPAIEEMLMKKFHEIRDSQVPMLNKGWKCTKFCHFGKTSFAGTHVKPIIERRGGQVTPIGQNMTMCEQTKFCIDNRGIDAVNQHMKAEGHDVSYYHAPGSVEEVRE